MVTLIDPQLGNFVLQAQAACATARVFNGSGPMHVTVAHDDWCALINGRGPCNCNPVVGPAMTDHEWRRRHGR